MKLVNLICSLNENGNISNSYYRVKKHIDAGSHNANDMVSK